MNAHDALFASALVLFTAVATTACSAAAGDEPVAQPEEQTATAASALANGHGGGGTSLYGCSGLMCTCTGDADCNDMFTNAGCGDITSCDNSGPEPVCWCLRGFFHTTTTGNMGVTPLLVQSGATRASRL